MDYSRLTLATLRAYLTSGEVLYPEFVDAWREWVAQADVDVNAYTAQFDIVPPVARITEHESLLTGAPLAIKDNICMKEGPTTASSALLQHVPSVYDATVVSKLRAHHPLFIGKTNMDEFAMGSSTETSALHPTHNPCDTARVPGGSSGGSAAAVASGSALGALGSDTGGSIRQPAALCGVVGLKPTYGRVSRYGLIAMASSLDCIGPLAKNVADARTLYNVIAGQDPRDATTSCISHASSCIRPQTLARLRRDVRTLIVGIPRALATQLHGANKAWYERLITDMEQHGVRCVEVDIPHLDKTLETYYVIMPAEVSSNMARYDGVQYRSAQAIQPIAQYRSALLGEEVRRRILVGTSVLSRGYYESYYGTALAMRTVVRQEFTQAFTEVDVIMTPTSPTPAWKRGEKMDDPITMYLSDVFTVSANIAGIPALSIPYGSIESLPMGVQLMADMYHEDVLFDFGAWIESIAPSP